MYRSQFLWYKLGFETVGVMKTMIEIITEGLFWNFGFPFLEVCPSDTASGFHEL